MATNRVTWEIMRTLDTATMTVSNQFYPVMGPLLYPSYKLKLVNTSNVLVTISIDGVNSYDVAPANSFFLYDETQASISNSNAPAIPAGTQISCSSLTPGEGTIYLVSQYLVQG